mmetsp:Transcript_89633/g.124501  ORF Transcript_89633/g.124501 Transcript_89633/m.124501 type:complete len:288 (-) Transcript_89633:194-1057(-)
MRSLRYEAGAQRCAVHSSLNPNIASAVSSWKPHFMAHHGTIWLCPEVDHKVGIQGQPTILRVDIQLNELCPATCHIWIELLVPGGEERSGHVEAFPVQGKLHHLCPTLNLDAFHYQRLGLCKAVLPLHGPHALQRAPDEELPHQLWLGSRDVVLPHVAMQPVGEIQEAVVQGNHEVGDESRHLWQSPSLLNWDGLNLNHGLADPFSILALREAHHLRAQRTSGVTLRLVGVMKETHLQRNGARSNIEFLLQCALGPIPDIKLATIEPVCNMGRVKALSETTWMSPFR